MPLSACRRRLSLFSASTQPLSSARRLACFSLLAAASTLGLGCQSTSTTSSGTGANGTVVQTNDLIERGFRVAWQEDLGLPKDTKLASSTLLGDLLVTVEHPLNVVNVFEASTGKRLWGASVGNPLGRVFAPVRIGDSIYLANAVTVFEYNAQTGRLRAARPLAKTASTGPVVVGTELVFGGATGDVWAQRSDTGGLTWQYKMANKIIATPMLVDETRLLVSDTSGHLANISLSGKKVWNTRTHGEIVTQPATAGLATFLPSTDQSLYALLLSNGEDLWPAYRSDTPLTLSPMADNTHVYLPIPGKKLVALDAADGLVKWEVNQPLRPIDQTADKLLCAGPDQIAYVDKATGDVLETIPSARIQNLFHLSDGKVVLVSDRGQIQCLAKR